MQESNGKIHEFENDEQVSAAEKALGERLVRLTNEEAQLLQRIPEEDRPRELALQRYVQERKAIGGVVNPWTMQAFRRGFDAARKGSSR